MKSKEPIFLILETSTEICSIGISKGRKLLSAKESTDIPNHIEVVHQFIKQLIEEVGVSMTEISAVVLSGGPGSYTGLRVAAACAKGICFSLSIPLISISNLEGLADYAHRLEKVGDYVIPMIDARRMEVYSSIYYKKRLIKEKFNIIINESTFAEYLNQGGVVWAIGNGATKTSSLIDHPHYITIEKKCSAELLCNLAFEKFNNNEFENIVSFSPFYLKKPNITQAKPKL